MLLDSIASERISAIVRSRVEMDLKRSWYQSRGGSRDAAGVESRWRRRWLGYLLDLRYEGSYKLALPPAGYPDTRISERHRSGLYRRTAVWASRCAKSRQSRWLLAKADGGQGGFITGTLAVIIFLQGGDETRAMVTRVTDLSRAREDHARARCGVYSRVRVQ
jgi:hypothetical protein